MNPVRLVKMGMGVVGVGVRVVGERRGVGLGLLVVEEGRGWERSLVAT